jgi:hypothetical protein
LANDAIKVTDGNAAPALSTNRTGTIFTAAVSTANTNLGTATTGVIEITGTNAADLTATTDGGALEDIVVAAIGTLGTFTGVAIIYGTSGGLASAGIYSMTFTDAGNDGVTATAEVAIELIAILQGGVAQDALTTANFYG